MRTIADNLIKYDMKSKGINEVFRKKQKKNEKGKEYFQKGDLHGISRNLRVFFFTSERASIVISNSDNILFL